MLKEIRSGNQDTLILWVNALIFDALTREVEGSKLAIINSILSIGKKNGSIAKTEEGIEPELAQTNYTSSECWNA